MRAMLIRLGTAVVACSALSLGGCGGSSSGKTDSVADEPAPPSAPAGSASGAPTAPSTPAAPGAAVTPPVGSTAGTARTVATGSFIDKEEHGSGMASLIIGTDNTPYLRLENVAISPGPALHVFLTKEGSPSQKADVDKGFVDLGALRATTGNLTYTIPAGTDLAAYQGVIVYCVEYNVVFTAATLVR